MPQQRKLTYQKLGAVSGIVSPILGFVCILTAVASYPAFSWTNNALSDLGIQVGVTGPLFNFGLVACGVLAFVFAVLGLYTYLGGRSWVAKIGSVVFATATLALVAIGIFNESFSPTHYLVSVAFFALAPLALFILTCGFCVYRQLKMAVFTVAIGAAAALPWILQFTLNYVPNVAIPEFTSGLPVSIWVVVVSKKMFNAKL